MTIEATLGLDNGHSHPEWLHAAAEGTKDFGDLAAEVEQRLRHEEQQLALIEAAQATARERVGRLRKAAAALRNDPPAAPRLARPVVTKRGPKAHPGGVSTKMVERVLAGLQKLGGEQRAKTIAQAAHVSQGTADKALSVLREREQVRVARQDPKFGKFFALMPDASDVDA